MCIMRYSHPSASSKCWTQNREKGKLIQFCKPQVHLNLNQSPPQAGIEAFPPPSSSPSATAKCGYAAHWFRQCFATSRPKPKVTTTVSETFSFSKKLAVKSGRKSPQFTTRDVALTWQSSSWLFRVLYLAHSVVTNEINWRFHDLCATLTTACQQSGKCYSS